MAFTEHYHTRFEEHKFYHIYNRTVDRKPMFTGEDNYRFFLQRYDHYLSPVLNTFAYCLLGNHFHLLVRVQDLSEYSDLTNFKNSSLPRGGLQNMGDAPQYSDLTTFEKLSNLPRAGKIHDTNLSSGKPKTPHDIVSHQFRKFFQSYAMAFNKQHARIGTLFQTPFKRAEVNNAQYFQNIICYIHQNPQLHRLVDDFKKWPWSSYGSILSDSASKLCKLDVLTWFGGKDEYAQSHSSMGNSGNDRLFIEDD